MIIIIIVILFLFSFSADAVDYVGLTAIRLEFPVIVPPAEPVRRACASIPIVDDMLVESAEMFFVRLQSDPRMPRNVFVGTNSTATAEIMDNDTPG